MLWTWSLLDSPRTEGEALAQESFNFRGTLPGGSKVDTITIKAKEDPADKRLRHRKELWSFVVQDLTVYLVSYGFVIAIGVYCCIVAVRHGLESPEAKIVSPIITTLFGGLLGVIVGRSSKS